MRTYLYAIYDYTGTEYGPVFEQKNDIMAMRSFETAFKENPYKQDFRLVRLAEVEREDTPEPFIKIYTLEYGTQWVTDAPLGGEDG